MKRLAFDEDAPLDHREAAAFLSRLVAPSAFLAEGTATRAASSTRSLCADSLASDIERAFPSFSGHAVPPPQKHGPPLRAIADSMLLPAVPLFVRCPLSGRFFACCLANQDPSGAFVFRSPWTSEPRWFDCSAVRRRGVACGGDDGVALVPSEVFGIPASPQSAVLQQHLDTLHPRLAALEHDLNECFRQYAARYFATSAGAAATGATDSAPTATPLENVMVSSAFVTGVGVAEEKKSVAATLAAASSMRLAHMKEDTAERPAYVIRFQVTVVLLHRCQTETLTSSWATQHTVAVEERDAGSKFDLSSKLSVVVAPSGSCTQKSEVAPCRTGFACSFGHTLREPVNVLPVGNSGASPLLSGSIGGGGVGLEGTLSSAAGTLRAMGRDSIAAGVNGSFSHEALQMRYGELESGLSFALPNGTVVATVLELVQTAETCHLLPQLQHVFAARNADTLSVLLRRPCDAGVEVTDDDTDSNDGGEKSGEGANAHLSSNHRVGNAGVGEVRRQYQVLANDLASFAAKVQEQKRLAGASGSVGLQRIPTGLEGGS